MQTDEALFEELIEGQQKRLLELAQELIPGITQEDILQPFDFPILENHVGFRYEEGVLEGMLTVRMAMLAKESDLC